MPSESIRRLLVNFILFQIGWFACLLIDSAWLYFIMAVLLLVHFLWVVPKLKIFSELSLLIKVLFVGLCLEIFYLQVGVLVQANASSFPPVWLLFIWVLFATTFAHSLLWLRNQLYVAAAFAAIAAPLSYYAGVQLNMSMSFHSNVLFSVGMIAVSWAIVFPLVLRWVLPNVTSPS